jgi:exopolysaccharide biosynthesis polyprenyl glycosylphosphotransferase
MAIGVAAHAGASDAVLERESRVHGYRPTAAAWVRGVRLGVDIVCLLVASGIGFLARFEWGWLSVAREPRLLTPEYRLLALAWTLVVLRAMASRRLYDEDTLNADEALRVWQSLLEAIAVFSLGVFIVKVLEVSRGWFALTALFSFVLLAGARAGTRVALRRMRERGRLRRPAVMVATDGRTRTGPWEVGEFDIVAHVHPDELDGFFRLSEVGRGLLLDVAATPGVFVQTDDLSEQETWRVVLEAGSLNLPVFLWSPIRSVAPERLTTRDVGDQTIVRVAPSRLTGVRAAKKRAFDLVVALALAPLIVPLAALSAMAVLVTSGRPVFFGQDRVGMDGRSFRMWKFRTMRPDASAERTWTVENDPRRTRTGVWLRRLGLDELPQFWNVLKGDMSIVGPRPEQMPFVERFNSEIEWYRYRHRLKPGITGLAQARGYRGDTSITSRVELDNWYIEHASVFLDAKIVVQTIAELFRGRNGY